MSIKSKLRAKGLQNDHAGPPLKWLTRPKVATASDKAHWMIKKVKSCSGLLGLNRLGIPIIAMAVITTKYVVTGRKIFRRVLCGIK